MRKDRALFSIFTLVFALTACGGGGGGGSAPVPPSSSGGGGGTTQQAQQQNTVAAADAAGAPVADVTSYESSLSNPIAPESASRSVMDASPSPGPSTSPSPHPTPPPNGACIANFFSSVTPGTIFGGNVPYLGFEYWKPDKAGDPNSVEYIFFYDTACTQIAKDHVRVINSITGTTVKTETVTVTVTEYKVGSSSPASQSVEVNTITGQFNGDGYPDHKAGFSRSSVFTLSQNGSAVINRGNEFIAMPTTTTTIQSCGDSAGYNALKLSATGAVHGYQNLLANATRTVNADGSVTWTSSHSGSTYSATPPATFTLNKGTLNTTCPITAAAFTLSGGTLVSGYSVPTFSATYKSGVLTNLTITNATLNNGYTLNVTTNTAASPTAPGFITGVIANGATTMATFSVDNEGNGTLTVTATGTQYTMEHWHIVHDAPSPSPSPSGSPSPSPTSSPH